MIGYVSQQLVDKREFFGFPKEGGREFRLLDYACGPGTISAVSISFFLLCFLSMDETRELEDRQVHRKASTHFVPRSGIHLTSRPTKALAPYTTSTLALDISPAMITEYKSRLPSPSHTALNGNLLATPPWTTSPTSPETKLSADAIAKDALFNDYDAAIVGFGFHHFQNWAEALSKLSLRVKNGGVVGIVDLVPDLDVGPSF
jgi:SAM-dependent methyltransferase